MEFGLDITEHVEELEEAEAAELETADEGLVAPGELDAPERPPAVFISYNRKHDERVARHIYSALSQKYEVYLDQETNNIGDDFVLNLDAWLNKADFFIILLSKGSLESSWVLAELEHAYRLNKEHGHPRVLPVRVAYTGPYPLDVQAYIGRIHALFWDDKNSASHVAHLQAAIENKPPPVTRSFNVGMDGMLVGDNRRARMAETFVAPQGVEEGLLHKCKLLWLTGDADVRNYAALLLAAREGADSLYEVTRSRSWLDVNNTGVSDSAIVLRDALPSANFDETTAGEELNSLRALIERGNVIIATAPYEEFERVRQEMLRYEFKDYEHRNLGRDSYDEAAKLNIFGKLLDFSLSTYDLNEDQAAWARELEARPLFQETIKKWSPSDIERFVVDSLPQAARAGDVTRLLQRNAALEDEVHSWFLSLDDSTRCFILTVALFPETEGDFLWEKYKSVVKELRRLDPQLSLQPFGICRQRAARYISHEGPLYVRDERVAEAIRQEITKNYREYFVELKDHLLEWTVPEGREAEPQSPQRKQKIKEGREVRLAIARMVGCAGRLGLEDLDKILEFWATDPGFYVRQAVGDALKETARSHNGINHALNLLEQWSRDAAPKSNSLRRTSASAIALGNLASAPLDEYAMQRLLECANRLARSRSRDVRFNLSIALRDLARGLPLASVKWLLERLAAEKIPNQRGPIRINVANALNAARAHDPEAEELWRQWAFAPEEWRRWTAICALLTWRGDKYPQLFDLLTQDETAQTVVIVCAELLGDEFHREVVTETFKRLVREAEGEARDRLASALARLPPAMEKRLLPLLRSYGSPALEERLVEVRRETLAEELATPERFASTLREWLGHEEARLEVFKAFALLVGTGTGGRREQVVAAFAERYIDDLEGTSGLLDKLETMAPANFAFLAPSVRLAAFDVQRHRGTPRPIFIRKPRPTFITKMVTRFFTKRS
jgi:hypothetical protein